LILSGFVFTAEDGGFCTVDLVPSIDGLGDHVGTVIVAHVAGPDTETLVLSYDSVDECLADEASIPEGVRAALNNLQADGYL
jgi:hypothetical protein